MMQNTNARDIQCSIDCRERGSHASGCVSYARMEQEEEADMRIIVKEEEADTRIIARVE